MTYILLTFDVNFSVCFGGRRGRVPMQSVHITTNAVSSNPAQVGVLDTTLGGIKFVSDLRQFPPPIKRAAAI